MLIDKPTTLFAGEVVQKSLHCVNLLWSNCMLKQVDTLYFCWSDGEIILKAGIVWVGWSFFVGQIGSISIPIVMFCYHCKIYLFSFCKRDKKKKRDGRPAKQYRRAYRGTLCILIFAAMLSCQCTLILCNWLVISIIIYSIYCLCKRN